MARTGPGYPPLGAVMYRRDNWSPRHGIAGTLTTVQAYGSNVGISSRTAFARSRGGGRQRTGARRGHARQRMAGGRRRPDRHPDGVVRHRRRPMLDMRPHALGTRPHRTRSAARANRERTCVGRPAALRTAHCELRFPGQWEDAERRLHYNLNRYYDPDTGQYLLPDLIGVEGGLRTHA